MIPIVGGQLRAVVVFGTHRGEIRAERDAVLFRSLIIDAAVVLNIDVLRGALRLQFFHIRHAVKAVADTEGRCRRAKRGIKTVQGGLQRRSQVEPARSVSALG